MHKKFMQRLTASIIIFLTAFGAVSAAEAAPATSAICIVSTRSGIASKDWDGKNPKTCKGTYQLWDISRGRTGLLLEVKSPNWVDARTVFKKGYKDAQKWCSNNSLTCNIVTSVGVSIVLGLLAK